LRVLEELMYRVETEREFLRPLPTCPPELAVWARVRVKLHPDCHVQFEKTCYSAAFALVRQHLWLRARETTVQLLACVSEHPCEHVVGQQVHVFGEHAKHQPIDEVRHRLRVVAALA